MPANQSLLRWITVLSLAIGAPSAGWTQPTTETVNERHEELKTRADALYRQKDYAQAEQLLSEVIEEAPKDDVALYLRGSSRVERGSAEQNAATIRAGINDARAALGVQMNVDYYLPYLFGMSRLAEIQGRPEHARTGIDVADKVLQMPAASVDQKANVHFQRGLLNVALDDKAAAEMDFRAAVSIKPNHAAAQAALCNMVLSTNPGQAEAQFDRAVAAAPNEPTLLNNRGTYLQNQGRYDEALKDFNQALTLQPQYVPALTNRGFVKIMTADFRGAEADLSKSLEIDPQQPVALGLRGAARIHLNRPDAAIQDYQTAAALDPQNPAAHYDLGFAHFFGRDYPEAREAFDQAVRLDPSLTFLAPWRYTAAVFAGQRDRAVSEFSSLEQKPAEQRNWTDLVTLYLMGKVNEETLLGAIDRTNPQATTMQECEANYFIGLRHASRNEQDRAKGYFEKALQTKARHLSAYRGAMYALGRFDAAQ
jgi:lipoprotein NlpI